ncbi:MYND-type domain-containing protein [Mycena venus]|uniref:MYND-type domain-containing protein n=1 Tax=Mycena venus TaxID=2733690 RepID=A0A8H6WUI9_9AGAR|nr:MYND-type domain-containing protein [Mycena venus]
MAPPSMLPRKEILGLLSSMGVDLPRKTKLPDTELDKRLSKALDSAQYLTRVIPTPPLDPTSYPSWFRDKSTKPVLEGIRRHNIAEATQFDASQMRGIDNPFPLYSNAFMDLRQTLMAIANACDNGMAPLILQDKGESSGICMRVLDVRQFDDQTPILIVVFQHDLKDSLSRGSFDWISSYLSGGAGRAMVNVTATVQEQQLLLRILNQNKKRLISSYKPKRASTESSFTLSFLLPVGPLGMQDMAKYNTNNGCSICGEPAKQKCSRCGAVRYCDAVCQKEDWKSHRPLCNGWKDAKWQTLTFVLADDARPERYVFRWNKYDNVQHNDIQKLMDRIKDKKEGDQGPPPNTHGTTPFIIKLQVSSSKAMGPAHTLFAADPKNDGADFLIYDQRRTIEVAVVRASSDTAAFDSVTEVVQAKGERGLKAFFWAIRTGEWTMDVCLDRLPEWQKW